MNTAVSMVHDARMAGVDYFNPDDYMLNIVRRATSNKQDVLLESDDYGDLLLLSSRGEYFDGLSNIQAFCTLPSSQIKVTILKPDDQRIPGEDMVGRNIDELMWIGAYYASDGHLMYGCYRDDVVEMDYWPNLTRLPHTANTPRIISLLSRHPTSITFAIRLLKIDASEVYQIYSAARSAGLARAINRKPEEPKLEPHRNQSLLSALLTKISGL